MQSNHQNYNYISSFRRIDEILALPAGNYEEVDSLPDRGKLTFSNGYYASCTAVFVDIRDSSSLPDHYTRPKLAKLYRAYISEVVALLNGYERAAEINIVGDGVWAVFDTPWKEHINEVFDLIAKVNSLIKVLNYKLDKAGYSHGPLKVGIGAHWGRALMIKAGYSGSGINDVVYMGDVVNRAAKLAALGSKNWNPPIYLSEVFHLNLDDKEKEHCTQNWHGNHSVYTANIINLAMEAWYDDNCT